MPPTLAPGRDATPRACAAPTALASARCFLHRRPTPPATRRAPRSSRYRRGRCHAAPMLSPAGTPGIPILGRPANVAGTRTRRPRAIREGLRGQRADDRQTHTATVAPRPTRSTSIDDRRTIGRRARPREASLPAMTGSEFSGPRYHSRSGGSYARSAAMLPRVTPAEAAHRSPTDRTRRGASSIAAAAADASSASAAAPAHPPRDDRWKPWPHEQMRAAVPTRKGMAASAAGARTDARDCKTRPVLDRPARSARIRRRRTVAETAIRPTPGRWQFLRGIPAARERSVPRS